MWLFRVGSTCTMHRTRVQECYVYLNFVDILVLLKRLYRGVMYIVCRMYSILSVWQIWNVHSVLNVLHSLVEKSNINRQLEVYISGGKQSDWCGFSNLIHSFIPTCFNTKHPHTNKHYLCPLLSWWWGTPFTPYHKTGFMHRCPQFHRIVCVKQLPPVTFLRIWIII